jgi:hypothetical protein
MSDLHQAVQVADDLVLAAERRERTHLRASELQTRAAGEELPARIQEFPGLPLDLEPGDAHHP